jgi:hypothetical protein
MVNKDFFLALEDLEAEKGISQQVFIEALENALVIAYKRNSGKSGGIEVRLNAEKAKIQIFSVRNVVEEVEDKDREISLEEARLMIRMTLFLPSQTREIVKRKRSRNVVEELYSCIENTISETFSFVVHMRTVIDSSDVFYQDVDLALFTVKREQGKSVCNFNTVCNFSSSPIA